MKKYITPTSYNSSMGDSKMAIPAILGAVAGFMAAGAAAKMVSKMFSVKMDDHLNKTSNNLKVE